MTRARPPVISTKKSPRQARSKQLVDDILEAAVRVLTREGARRFTTVRVAEAAGVSVGSLYQYFPNKEALLFRLQADEWAETGAILEEMLADTRLAPLDRLRRVVLVFFRSEREESALRGALDDAGALIRDAPEARAHRAAVAHRVLGFLAEALPSVPPGERAFVADFLVTSLSAVAERITKHPLPRAELDTWARATAELHCGYLERLERDARKARQSGGRRRAADRAITPGHA
jgi:AcrR family transcriptional regulator